MSPSSNIQHRLKIERNIWLASVRPDGRPHMVPVWFVWHSERLYICIKPNSVKARNIARNSTVAMSLEDGSNVVICEGQALSIPKPWPATVQAGFETKYDWNISTDIEYTLLLEIKPAKWLTW